MSCRFSVAVLSGLLPLFLSACGQTVEASAPATVRVELEWDGEPASDVRTVASIEIPERLDGWTVQARNSSIQQSEDGRSLRVSGSQDPRMIVPLPESALGCDLAVVDVTAEVPLRLRLGLGWFEGEELRARWCSEVKTVSRDERVKAEFELEPRDQDRFLVVHAHFKSKGRFSLNGIELMEAPPERRIAALDEAPRWIEVGGEARPTIALARGRGARSRIEIPRGGILHLATAPAPGVQVAGAVTYRITDEEGTREIARLALDPEQSAWRDEEVPLEPWAGRTVELEVEVEGAPLALLTSPEVFIPRANPPTVLLISSDTHRADHVGSAMSSVAVTTPALDRLASEGVFFERAFASSNITLPSHATLLTGLNPRDTGVIDNMTLIGGGALTLAERFRSAGWLTYGAVSARHLAPATSGFEQGFDRYAWPSEVERTGGRTIAGLRSWLDKAEGRPLFVFLHVFDAHRPYQAEEETARASYPGKDPFDSSLPEVAFPTLKEASGSKDPEWIRAIYRAQIDELDRELGRLFDHRRFRDAVVAFTADHGESLGENGLWWDHMGAFPSVLQVPLILRWPGGPTGLRVSHTVAQADLGRTLLSLAGVPPAAFPGEDLRNWLEEAPPTRTRFAVAGCAHSFAVTRENWHLTVTLNNGGNENLITRDNAADAPIQLFDLDVDPTARMDLAERYPERVAKMTGELISWLDSPRTSLAVAGAGDEATLDLLAELGYASGSTATTGAAALDADRVREVAGTLLAD